MLRRRVALVPLALAAALVVGCAPVDRAAETPAPVLPAEAAPSPTPTPTPDLEPVLAFDGDCDQMLTSEQRDELLGAGLHTGAEHQRMDDADLPVAVDFDPVGTLGGIACSWFADEGTDLPDGVDALTVTVVPATEVSNEFAARYSVATCEPKYDSTSCRLGRVVGDAWIGASAGWGPAEAPNDLLTAAIDAVSANLPTATQPRRAVATDDVWSVPDCIWLGEAMGIEELIGPYLHGYWEGSEQPEEVLLAAAGAFRTCPLFSDGERIDYDTQEFHILAPQVAPGLSWQWDEVRARAQESSTFVEVDVAGAADAFAVDWGHGSHKAFATDGTNVVSVYESDLDLAAQVLARMLTALSS
ncbi:hypothetical protein [Microbacterium sp. AG238]|uniref:hypothetical protein n=1 Tax=Microbacterium sp. AG238 TaxID=2183994 RepID=UPI000E7570BF|nr:hypothetical protein [Microbacterium sp. AG238]RKE60282.1 hypothetical protein DEU36_2715 [Microbacterium sp. AG238]